MVIKTFENLFGSAASRLLKMSVDNAPQMFNQHSSAFKRQQLN